MEKAIEIGQLTLSPEEEVELSDARKLLFREDDVSKPTLAYANYRKLLADIGALEQELQDETAEAARKAIDIQLRALRRRLNRPSTGRDDFEDAEEVVQRLGGNDSTSELVEDFKKALNAAAEETLALDLDAFSQLSGWMDVTIPVNKLPLAVSQRHVTLRNAHATLRVKKMSIRVAGGLLGHPLFRNRGWRTNGLVLSKEARESIETNLDKELVPRVVTSVFLAKSVDITFDADEEESSIALQDILARNPIPTKWTFGEIQFDCSTGRQVFSAPGFLSMPPCIIAVQVTQVPLRPNPSAKYFR
ncbi:MAG: hypothetical protein AAFX06_18505 [Planctomycetota bacterium]